MKKKYKILIISLVVILFLIIGCGIYFHTHPSIAILGYHSFYDKSTQSTSENQFIINTEDFEKQMRYLSEHNFKTLTLDEFYCWKQGNCNFGLKTVMITVDDGYYSNYQYAFDILKKYNLNAVVFVVGSFVENAESGNGFMSLEDIRDSKEKYPNIEFASHTYDMHGDHNVTNMTRDEISADVQKFSSILDTKYLAYPEGKYNDDFIGILKENGYNLAFGYGPVHKKATRKDDDYIISRLSISEGMPFWKFKLRIIWPY